ncbi:MAG: PhoH family protein [Candidatus Parcubacteria bacterium]|jgi:PhoH-like ATPase|nr:MAG: PhoH family protein [Candidatus Parcubacteria bacterium]
MERKKKISATPEEKANTKKGNVIIVDTNVLINDYTAIEEFIKGDNLLIIPRMVILELDGLKKKPEVSHEARMASNLILKYHQEGKLQILWSENFSKLGLDKEMPDNRIIACLNHVVRSKTNSYPDYQKIKLVTDDTSMLLLASSFFEKNKLVEVERFKNIRVSVKLEPRAELETVKMRDTDYEGADCKIKFCKERFPELKANGGIIINEQGDLSLAYRKGSELKRIPKSISACAVKSQNEGARNWEQELLLAQLLDPEIQVVLASGSAGSGKTLLALASALEQRSNYRNIILTRPTILIGDIDRLGFLPGDMNAKMAEYMDPFLQNLEVIIDANAKNPDFFMHGLITPDSGTTNRKKTSSNEELLRVLRKRPFEFLAELGIKVNSIQYYKGRTYHKTCLIIDEAQDLSPIEVKQIITRMGRNSKVILVGDLGQIDRRFLNADNSGLAYAMAKMEGNPMIGVTHLTHTVRSEVAAFAEKVL